MPDAPQIFMPDVRRLAELPASRSAELYLRPKQAGVLVLSGHYFFPGLDDETWPHRHECLRISFAQAEDVVREGIRLIGRLLLIQSRAATPP